MSVAGLRIGEAIRLKLEDVNLQEGLLTIRGAKFGKSRLVPIHRSTQEVGHQSVETTMIYTHVLNKGGKGVRSPLDRGAPAAPAPAKAEHARAAYRA